MRFLWIDGNSIFHRAYHAVRTLTNQNGVFTNAIFGFLKMYFKACNTVKPDGAAVAFDLKKPTFRHEQVETYKANRKGMPDELAMQMPYLKEILGYMGIACLDAEGFEADDILGTLAHACDEQQQDCVLMTGDRDSLQLITHYVTVHLETNKGVIVYTPAKFQENYGFAPEFLVDLKALMGDSSDNISGVKGIGEKTAKTLIEKHHTIENLYANLENLQATPRVKKLLSEGKADAVQSKWLATIVRNAPVSCNLTDYLYQAQDTENLRSVLTELEMYTILHDLHLEPLAVPAVAAAPVSEMQTEYQLCEWDTDKIINADSPVSYLLEEQQLTVCIESEIYQTSEVSEIINFLASETPKYTDNAKPHYRYMLLHNRKLQNIRFDASVCGYIRNPSASDYSIAALCRQYRIPRPDSAFADILVLKQLAEKGIQEIKSQNMQFLWEEIELPLTRVLASMEHEGILIDTEGIAAFGEKLKKQIAAIQQQIYDYAGEAFNIASPKQLGNILFEKLDLPVIKVTKTGYSTNAEVLEQLQPKHPIIKCILEYRQYTKLQSTYVDGLQKAAGADGRIHTNYKQTETRTGRISSTEPNLQNIPVRTELGREMRKFFKARENYILLDADYSQIELRVMAHLSQDKAMQEAFQSGIDIHTATAAKIFNTPELLITPEMRSASKAVNFGILYGMGAFSLSKDIHVSRQEAQKYINEYLGSYPKVSRFLDDVIKHAMKQGYVCTMYHRRRYVPELQSKNKQIQAAGKRIAMNTPVQGTAADIIKLAMIRVHDRLEKEVPSAKLVLQVHDELIIEVPVADAEQAAVILHEEMTNAAVLSVPLLAEVKRGHTWYDAKD